MNNSESSRKLLIVTFSVNNKELNFLVDTGAAISIIKSDTLKNLPNLDRKEESHGIQVCGIGEEKFEIKEYVILNVFNKYTHNFYVININIPFDGILGIDFLKKYNAEINLANAKLKLQNKVPVPKKSNDIRERQPFAKITIKSRTEQIIPILIKNVKNGDCIIEQQELDNKLLIPNALVSVKNYVAYTSCINKGLKPIEYEAYRELEGFPVELEEMRINTINYEPKNRTEKVVNQIRTDHMNSEEKRNILNICKDFKDIFHIDGDTFSFSNTIKHAIDTGDSPPVYTKNYRYPQVHKAEVKDQIQKLLAQKIIQPSHSPYNSPIWIVPKKLDASGRTKWRMVIDYRKLNEVSKGDKYPIPNIVDILDKLGKSKYFSTLDLASGFHQIEVDPRDVEKTAFSTEEGHFEYLRMPFGLKNAPATFQRVMDNVLTGLTEDHCLVYLDDIIIHASSLEEHELKLRNILKRLRDYNLKLQPDKCEFLRKEVAYLGHIISDQGIKPNPDKIKAVQNFPQPKTTKQIKAFLGLAGYYRRFINNFSDITKPLTKLLKKNAKYIWTEECTKAMEKCKELLTTAPILQYPDFEKEFIVTTDASQYAIGGILSQGKVGGKPIAYASRTLNQRIRNKIFDHRKRASGN